MIRNKALFLLLWIITGAHAFEPGPDYRDIATIDHVRIDLRYATRNNFMNQNLYGEFKKIYLHKIAFKKLQRAAALLQQKKPAWSLLVFDGARPRSVQKRMWDKVAGTPQQRYVANPKRGSVHNFGFAVDLSLADDKGNEVDMGTPYDSFEPLAQPRLENKFRKSNKISDRQLKNRLLLRSVMTEAGFIQLPIEWWHYDALPSRQVRKKYPIIE